MTRFESVFDCPNTFRDRLFALGQGAWSLVDFGRGQWLERAGPAFHLGLDESVRHTLVRGARPRNFAEVVDRAIKLDNYQF